MAEQLKVLKQERSVDCNGTTYLISAYISEGILNAVVTLNHVPISNSRSGVDDGLREKVKGELSMMEEVFFKRRPNSMCRHVIYKI